MNNSISKIDKVFWYRETIPRVLEILNSYEKGLSNEEAQRRLRIYGQNKLPEVKTDSYFLIFLRQFQNPLIYILFFAAGIIFAIGEITDGFIIFTVLIFNAIVGSIQEGKAQNTLLALKKFTETSATVLREGKEIIISDTEIVPGDIILLQEGEKIPSDARIIFTNTLKIDEASLTGESGPVSKTETILSSINSSSKESIIPVSDQRNMVFKGTNVLSGHGTALVVATGVNTEIGKIAKKISKIDTEIPLKTNIRYLSRIIIITVVVISLILIGLGLSSGESIKEMFKTVVALSVSIIPEGLPIVMTLVLATGVRRMSKRNVLVKRLQAVEALGQTKIIAVDKTGTLTKNEMVIQRVFVDGKNYEIGGSGYEPKGDVFLNGEIIDPLSHNGLVLSAKVAGFFTGAKLSFLESEGIWKIAGDPTEAALQVFSEKVGFQRDLLEKELPKVFEIPFDYKKKFHSVIRQMKGENFLAVTGAPEKVLDLCKNIWHEKGQELLNEEKRKELEIFFDEMAGKGFRLVACAINSQMKENIDLEDIPPLSFLGLFGMKDAVRSEVKEAIQKVREAGMRLVMITGDHRLTAYAVAREAGLWREGENILTGEEIDTMTGEELKEKIAKTTVFARVTPDHKLKIIQAYRNRGEIVAMTGDGVNDAPSLVAADLGVAMGKIGTEVTKEASDIVLLDDNFASIISAAEEGRGIYKTIKKVMLYLFSTSMGEVLVIAGSILLDFPLPLIAAQIIWLNFVTDGFLDVALAMEPKEEGLMRGKFEKPKKWIIDNLMVKRMFLMSLPMAIGTLFLFSKYFESDLTKAWTISLTTLAVFQWFNAWNCRSERESIFRMNPFSNKFLLGATFVVISLQIMALHLPFLQRILHTKPLLLSEWVAIALIATSVILIEEIRKIFSRRNVFKTF